MTDDGSTPSSQPSSEQSTDVQRFVDAFVNLLDQVGELRQPAEGKVSEMVVEHLRVDPSTIAPVGQRLPRVERPNLQLAMDHLMADDTESKLIGLSPEIIHYSGFSFSTLLAGRFRGPGLPVSPVYEEHPIDIDETLRCLTIGIWLIHHDGQPAAVCVSTPGHHGPPEEASPRVEVFAADEQTATSLLDHIQQLRRQLNVYRGKVLSFSHSEYGDFGINFMARPTTTTDDVIMADGVLESIERHAIEIGRRADQLLAAGQHLKRGLLLYGPPGTGKTHTISYLLNAMPERTAVILQGASLGALGYGAAIVRSLTPSMLVIEDIDIIAAERGMYDEPGHPLLFELLNEMDGLTATDDVLFVLTTNRPEVLEPALAARPGRIDHSVEIGLPGPRERRDLLSLYLAESSHEITSVDEVVERTEGVTASFIKELVRRATLATLERSDDGSSPSITDDDIDAALTELIDNAPPVGRVMNGLPGGAMLDNEFDPELDPDW